MLVYYNEFDKKKCAALKQLMADGHIAEGVIDDRSIKDVQPGDLEGFTRCHFFAGIGLWELALNLARWPEDRAVWTGSCPCQPYSSAGRQKGKADDRHLWPEWLRLIEQCKPSAVFGEQVATAIAHGWLDDVYQGMEAEGYAVGSAVLPASSVGAPHRRERLWFVGHSEHDGSLAGQKSGSKGQAVQHNPEGAHSTGQFKGASKYRNVADTKRLRSQGQRELPGPLHTEESGEREAGRTDYDSSRHWENGIWINCPDGKQRLVEPGIPLLAHGYPERVGVIHCAGDAIVPNLAAEFIKASMR